MSSKNWNARDKPKEAHHGRNRKHKKLYKKEYENGTTSQKDERRKRPPNVQCDSTKNQND